VLNLDVNEVVTSMRTRPRAMAIRDVVMMPTNFDLQGAVAPAAQPVASINAS
jgi:hypothetical protein